MKTKTSIPSLLAVVALLANLATGLQAQSTTNLPAYESFSTAYTANEYLGGATSVTFWSTGNGSTSSGAKIIAAAAMSYPGLTTEPTSTSYGIKGGTGTGKNRGFVFNPAVTTNANNTIYASFLFNLQTNNPSPRLFTALSSGTGTGPAVDAGIYIDTANHLLVGKNAALAATSLPNNLTTYSLTASNTYLVVLRYKFNAGSTTNDEVAMWLDPTSLGNNGNVPPPTLTVTNGTDTTASFQSFYYLAASSGLSTPVNFFMDEIRVGTNWAQVTPTNSMAGNVYNVTGGGSGCPGASYDVMLSGSDSGVNYLLYTNGVYTGTSMAGNGSSLDYGLQSLTATYTVLATNTSTFAVGWMNSNAVVSVQGAPVITAQPVAVTTATNATIIYSVTADGGGLTYSWYRNGSALSDDARHAGTKTSMMFISPVLAADAAVTASGYYCVISNSCSLTATTITNGLTIVTANNLVWQGTSTNLWDLATSTAWTNTSGTVTNFHSGDNVTFDDTFSNAVVNIASPILSPGSMVFNSTQTIGFSGSGSIFGSNSVLQIIGTGTLAVTNANSFGGGTTISNGTVLLKNYAGLGSGPVNLVGGSLGTATLRCTSSGSASSGLYNSLNLSANSILQFDATGTYGCVLFGPVTGASGVTLTVNHTGSATDRLRIYNTNFTCNANILLNANFQMAPYHSSGTQNYNGVISGTGSLITRNSGGTVCLNGQNTYSGGTTLSLGIVGVGSDSAGDLSYSPFGTQPVTIDVTSGNSSLFANGAAHSIGNAFTYSSTTNTINLVFTGTNQLTLTGMFNLDSASDTAPTNRTLQVDNTAPTILTGVVADNSTGSSLACGIVKTGNGALYLNGVNTYTGDTTNTAGLLAGTGTIAGKVIVNSGATLGGGDNTGIGTLTISSNLTLNGNAFIRLNKSLSPQSNDMVSVTGSLTNSGTGTLTVTNLGVPALAIGDSFKIFSGAVSNGAAITVTGGGMNWNNKLAVDGSIQALSVATTMASYSTNITASVINGGTTLNVKWPTTHLGWELMMQTNTLAGGLGNNWVTNYGTASVTSTNLPINPNNGSVFYKLVHP